MVLLLPDEKPLPKSTTDYAQIMAAMQPYQAFLLSNTSQSLTLEDKIPQCLYINQRELALVRNSDPNLRYLASDDATTCHIIIIYVDNNSVKVSPEGEIPDFPFTLLAHYDGKGASSMEAAITQYCQHHKVRASDFIFKCHFIGGFLDDKHHSQRLTEQVVKFFNRSALTYQLVSFQVTEWNDKVMPSSGLHHPRTLGALVEMQHHTVFTFDGTYPLESRIPERLVRNIRFLSPNDCMLNVYDPIHCLIKIDPVDFKKDKKLCNYLKYLCSLPDQMFLQRCSTSPDQEPAHFVHSLREVYNFVLQTDDLNRTQALIYRYLEGQWVRQN